MKETDVYAAPITDVILALHNTKPKNLYPKFPAPYLKADAAGFSGSKLTPCETTAKNR